MARVPNCKGSYYVRKDGSCQIKFPLGYSERLGKYDNYIESMGTEAEAIAALKDINAYIYHGGSISGVREHRLKATGREVRREVSFSEFAAGFIADREAQGNVAARTLSDYRTHVKRMEPYLGATAVSAIGPEQVNDLYSGLRGDDSRNQGAAPASGTYLQHIHGTLSQIMDRAVKYGVVKSNPCKDVDKPKRDTGEKAALTVPQCRQFLSNVLSEELDSKTVGLLICLFTAARLSEMLALTWGDLDGDCLHIWRSMVKDTQQTKATKTEDERFEPCPAVLVDVLAEWKFLQEQEFKAKGLRQSGETPIVSSKKGTHVLKTTFERWFRRNRVRMGLPEDFTIHGLRHTVTTILQKDIKADMTTTMSITGHKTMQMLQRYSHTDDSAKRAAMDAFNSLLAPDSDEARCRNCAMWTVCPGDSGVGACWGAAHGDSVRVTAGMMACDTDAFRLRG